MTAALVALLLCGAPEVVPAPAAPPSIGELRLQLETLHTRRTEIHWLVPAIVAGVGLYAGWTGVEGVVVTALLGCHDCGNYEGVSAGVAIGGAVIALVGLIWLAIDFYLRSKLSAEIERVENQLLDRRGAEPGPPLAVLRF